MHVYTICSYSNLNQAIVLFKSIKENTRSPFSFSCFLIDEIPAELTVDDLSFQLIRVAELQRTIKSFGQLKQKYNPFELCCALKPFCGTHLASGIGENEIITYLDSDIFFYDDIQLIAAELGSNDVVLTPHFTTPPPDFRKIGELDVNNSGLYNGGFFAFRKNSNTAQFLEWWRERMEQFCFTDFEKGMFVDQVWLNFVPLYFERVLISKHGGLNVAYWNFHERKLSLSNGNTWMVNQVQPLVFVHYSGFRLYRKDLISIHQNRYTFKDVAGATELFTAYATALETNAAVYKFEIPVRTFSQRVKAKLKTVFGNTSK